MTTKLCVRCAAFLLQLKRFFSFQQQEKYAYHLSQPVTARIGHYHTAREGYKVSFLFCKNEQPIEQFYDIITEQLPAVAEETHMCVRASLSLSNFRETERHFDR
jgi:hypothetical protein